MKIWGCILRHELKKIFSDKKVVCSMFVLPIILVMITSLLNSTSSKDNLDIQPPRIYVLNNLQYKHDADGIGEVILVEEKTLEELEKDTKLQPEDVVLKINEYETMIYYNGANATSQNIMKICREQLIQNILQTFAVTNEADISEKITVMDINEKKTEGKSIISILLSYMLVLSIFQDTYSFSIDAVAGEKERGIFCKTMLAPISMFPVMFGKVVAGTLCGLLSSGVYMFVVVVFSFIPRFDVFGLQKAEITLLMIIFICICAAILSVLFASLCIICSLFAKTVAEAKSMCLPVYGVIIVMALAAMMRMGKVSGIHYMIPVYNMCLIMQDILNATVEVRDFMCTVTSLLICCMVAMVLMIFSIKKEGIRY